MVRLAATPEYVDRVARLLFDAGWRVHAVPAGPHVEAICAALNDAGVVALVSAPDGQAVEERPEDTAERTMNALT
jgi:hypothetical protein